jgi:phosphoserine phosphatase
MIIASDLNGTLTTGAPALAVTEWIKTYQPDRYPLLYKYRLLISYLRVKFGWIAVDIWADKVLREVLALIQFPDENILDSIMKYVVESELWPKRRKDVVALLQDYHTKGAEIIIISAAYEPAVKIFAQLIGNDRVTGIGTPVRLTENGLTLAEKLTVRELKLKRIYESIGSRQLDIALGDTSGDIPMLEKSREPIAVYPDKKLRSVAESRSWKILE